MILMDKEIFTTLVTLLLLPLLCLRAEQDTEYDAPSTENPDSDPDQDLPEHAIVRGINASPHRFKWMVSLRYDGRHACGGVLITDRLVLTAAHCLFEKNSDYPLTIDLVTVGVGSANLSHHKGVRAMKISGYTSHPGFLPGTHNPDLKYDIGVVRLARSVSTLPPPVRRWVGQIDLPPAAVVGEEGPDYTGPTRTVLRTLGWGREHGLASTGSQTLLTGQMTVLSRKECQQRYGTVYNVTKHVLCTDSTGADVCQGDSGGPLISSEDPDGRPFDRVVGIVSMSSGGCGVTNSASVYTRVSEFVDNFIATEMQRSSADVERATPRYVVSTTSKRFSSTRARLSSPKTATKSIATVMTTTARRQSTTTRRPSTPRSTVSFNTPRKSTTGLVRLQQNGRHFCRGILIAGDRVLTAASCLYSVTGSPRTQQTMRIVVGGSSGPEQRLSPSQVYRIRRIHWHPRFRATGTLKSRNADVVVLEMDGTIDRLPPILFQTVSLAAQLPAVAFSGHPGVRGLLTVIAKDSAAHSASPTDRWILKVTLQPQAVCGTILEGRLRVESGHVICGQIINRDICSGVYQMVEAGSPLILTHTRNNGSLAETIVGIATGIEDDGCETDTGFARVIYSDVSTFILRDRNRYF